MKRGITMSINRQALKQNAKQTIRASNPKVLNTGTIYVVLTLIMSVLSARLMSVNMSEHDIMQIYEHLMNENYEFAFEYMQRYMPPYSSYLIDAAIEVVMSIVSVGFIIFLLNTIRATSPCYGNLLDGFGMAGRIILLYLLESIFVFLWSLLLIVPGIIASYRYRQAIYILIDHPEMSVWECIKESKRIMNGKKAELFVLDLSFLGWNLLSVFTVIGWAVQLWTVPYTGMTYALYYEHLLKEIGGGNYSAESSAEL
jgi:uncharacterized membrane protein